MKFHISFEHLQEANDELTATTHYGGWVVLNCDTVQNEVVYVNGTDRGSELYWHIRRAVEEQLGRELDDHEADGLDGALCDSNYCDPAEFVI